MNDSHEGAGKTVISFWTTPSIRPKARKIAAELQVPVGQLYQQLIDAEYARLFSAEDATR